MQYICGREPKTIIELIFEMVIKSMYYDIEDLLGIEHDYRYTVRKYGYILRTDDANEAKRLRSLRRRSKKDQQTMFEWIMERMLSGDEDAFEADTPIAAQGKRVA